MVIAGKGFIEKAYVRGRSSSATSIDDVVEVIMTAVVIGAFKHSRIHRDSTSIPHYHRPVTSVGDMPWSHLYVRWLTRPPPKNKIEMDTCSRSCDVQACPQAARCSRNILLAPYKNITVDSTDSADGTMAFRDPTMLGPGLTFHAQPKSAKHPIHRPKVRNPYQTKMPPLMKCARPLNTCLSRYVLRIERQPQGLLGVTERSRREG